VLVRGELLVQRCAVRHVVKEHESTPDATARTGLGASLQSP
jgi:hypothetical protein